MKKTFPAISIIIPMYNVEKYIGECLDSILAQTFTDYEVIAVDDCSTDKTCEVVESYLPRFNDKLRLIRSKVNSGGAGTPRNTGMRFAIGDYLMFIDSDDAIIKNTLEKLFDVAKKFNCDIVHCEKWYETQNSITTDLKSLKETSREHIDFVKEPTLIKENLGERVKAFIAKKFWTAPWNYLFNRKFLMYNDITFPKIGIGDDLLFDFKAICLAKDIVRVPITYYVWRQRSDSNTNVFLSPEKFIRRDAKSIFEATGMLEKFMNHFEEFVKNPKYKTDMFEFFMKEHVDRLAPVYSQIPAWQLDPLIRRELSEIEDKTALTAFLFARMNLMNVQLLRVQNLLRQQPKEAQDFQRQNEIIQRQQAQIQQLQQQLRNVHDIFR